MTDDPDNGQGTSNQGGSPDPGIGSGPQEDFVYHLGDQIFFEGEWHQWAGWAWIPVSPFDAEGRPPPPAPNPVWRDDRWQTLEPIPSGTPASGGHVGVLREDLGLTGPGSGIPPRPGRGWWLLVGAALVVAVAVTAAMLALLSGDDDPGAATEITGPVSSQAAVTTVTQAALTTVTQAAVTTSTTPVATSTTEPAPEGEVVPPSNVFVSMESGDRYPIYISSDRFVVVIPEIANCTFVSTAPNVAVRYGVCDHFQALDTISNTNPEPPPGTARYDLDGGNGMIVDFAGVGDPAQVSVARILGGEEGSVPDLGSLIGFAVDQVPELPDGEVLAFDFGPLSGTTWVRASG